MKAAPDLIAEKGTDTIFLYHMDIYGAGPYTSSLVGNFTKWYLANIAKLQRGCSKVIPRPKLQRKKRVAPSSVSPKTQSRRDNIAPNIFSSRLERTAHVAKVSKPKEEMLQIVPRHQWTCLTFSQSDIEASCAPTNAVDGAILQVDMVNTTLLLVIVLVPMARSFFCSENMH